MLFSRVVFRLLLTVWMFIVCLTYAAAAAKSLQSCPTLRDPIDGSPPGSPIPGILQARTLEWVAISFSNAWKWEVKVKSLSRVRLLVTPWTRLLHPWDFPGKCTGVRCHCLLRDICYWAYKATTCIKKVVSFTWRRKVFIYCVSHNLASHLEKKSISFSGYISSRVERARWNWPCKDSWQTWGPRCLRSGASRWECLKLEVQWPKTLGTLRK